MKPTKLAAAAALAAALPAGASAQEVAADPAQEAAVWHEQQRLALATRAAEGWQGVDSGIVWRRTAGDGSGAHPTLEDVVTVHYAGSLVDGTEFDSTYPRGTPATMPLADLIPAWQLVLPLMGVGDTIEFAVPAVLGYGVYGRGPIRGGATMLFKIELLAIEGR